jgi:hypothetical protein
MARDVFERIVNAPDSVAGIRALINTANPTPETDWLDFKTEPHDQKQRDRKIGETWSEALGGFANNQGGVLIWGIDARKIKVRGVEIDAAWGEKPMTDPIALMSRLTELQRGATDPPLANVEIKPYELPERPGSGFVVCYVPEGAFKPYRSEQASRQYYLRAGDNFIVMPRSVLAAMFHPRSRPVFKARATLSWALVDRAQVGGRDVAQLACNIELINSGTASAKDVFILVKTHVKGTLQPDHIEPAPFTQHLGAMGSDTELRLLRPMHPRQRFPPLFKARWSVAAGSSQATGYTVVPNCTAPVIELAIFCENHEQQAIRLEFDTAEMLERRDGCCREATATD